MPPRTVVPEYAHTIPYRGSQVSSATTIFPGGRTRYDAAQASLIALGQGFVADRYEEISDYGRGFLDTFGGALRQRADYEASKYLTRLNRRTDYIADGYRNGSEPDTTSPPDSDARQNPKSYQSTKNQLLVGGGVLLLVIIAIAIKR